MEFKKITAIIRQSMLHAAERALEEAGVHGLTISPVVGFGEYVNYFRRDHTSHHIRLEIVTTSDRVDEITRTVINAAHCGCAGDGLVIVQPLDEVLRIRTKGVPQSNDI